MFSSKAFLSLILLALTVVDARPLSRSTGKATLGFATRTNGVSPGTLNVAERDRARAQAFKNSGNHLKIRSAVNVTNAVQIYTAEVGIGSPPTSYTLLVDTGSSNTWVGSGNAYVPTSTSESSWDNVQVKYGSGEFSGVEWTDKVTLSPDLVINGQSIGVASSSQGFQGFDGILGVGPVGLTQGTVNNVGQVPTVTDNLFSQGTISEEVLGIYFVPASEENSGGNLTFGGVDSSVITGSINYVPLTTTSPASNYWGIDQSIAYGNSTILSTTAGIVDTGTTLVLIATDAFNAYQAATGGQLDSATGCLTITPSQYADLKKLTFNIGGQSYDLSPNAQIWPRSLNTALGGSADMIYLIVGDIGSNSGSGFDFINGYTFLERYYSVFDTTNSRVGFAKTAYTDSILN